MAKDKTAKNMKLAMEKAPAETEPKKRGRQRAVPVFVNQDEVTGLARREMYIEKYEKNGYYDDVPFNQKHFANVVATADDKKVAEIYDLYMRGIEGQIRSEVAQANNTFVNLSDGRHDLMAEKEVFWKRAGGKPTIVIKVVNNALRQFQLLVTDDMKEEQVDALRKKSIGWFNTADQLVAKKYATWVPDTDGEYPDNQKLVEVLPEATKA